jgi:hypothetical protein
MPDAEPTPPPRQPFQFSLATLLLITALLSVLAAALAGMLRRQYGGSSLPSGFFVVMAVAAPMAVMILISLLYSVVRFLRRRR